MTSHRVSWTLLLFLYAIICGSFFCSFRMTNAIAIVIFSRRCTGSTLIQCLCLVLRTFSLTLTRWTSPNTFYRSNSLIELKRLKHIRWAKIRGWISRARCTGAREKTRNKSKSHSILMQHALYRAACIVCGSVQRACAFIKWYTKVALACSMLYL